MWPTRIGTEVSDTAFGASEGRVRMKGQPNFSGLLQPFFTDHLLRQRNASPHTIASYRNTFRLLLEFAQQRLRKSSTTLALDDLDAPFIGRFLDHPRQLMRGASTAVSPRSHRA